MGAWIRHNVTYLKDVMDYHNVFYLPHFGGISDKIKKYKERNIEIFFPASYLDIRKFVMKIQNGVQVQLK